MSEKHHIEMEQATGVIWPARYSPNVAPVHVRNEIIIAAPPEVVWAWLIRATNWPTWYSNSQNVRQSDGIQLQDLALGSVFRWKTFGVAICSTVREFQPFNRLAWDAQGFGVDAYHAWVLTAHNEGCHVLTEETQYGWGARLLDFLMPQRMWKGHELWLSSLRDKSLQGKPLEYALGQV
ncbi:SRPBCC domain-containing protein [Dechloromonas sp.]|uniref:SRPBCC domain-containing protein n=1 Tax=Dechloromonas sp. TaxID=1917218 RepID=UPI00216F625F|nr:SRPBCC domain-containing protein [Dechloromonas sp.]MBU3696032.1 SRPBCC domain-containing protein [Dechloromonas sp.]